MDQDDMDSHSTTLLAPDASSTASQRIESGLPSWYLAVNGMTSSLPTLSGQENAVEAASTNTLGNGFDPCVPTPGQQMPLQIRNDVITQSSTSPNQHCNNADHDPGMLHVLLKLRQNVQQELDDAFLKGHIIMDCGTSLDEKVSGYFAEALRHVSQRRSTEHTSTMGEGIGNRRCQTCGSSSTPFAHSSSHFGTGTGQLAPVLDLNSIDLISAEKLPPIIAETKDQAHGDDVVVSKRRKRMPKITGYYPCAACERVFDRAGDRTKHVNTVHAAASRAKHHCQQCNKGFPYPMDLKRHIRKIHSVDNTGLPITPGTLSTNEGLSSIDSMPDGVCYDSYFPPVDEYWSAKSTSIAPPTSLAPLLPTPVSPALPLPDSCLFGDLIEDEPAPSTPTYSCPPADTCVIEALALLFGSVQLLVTAITYHQGNLDVLSWISELGTSLKGLNVPKEVNRLEPCLRRLLAPLVNASDPDFDIAEALWKHWQDSKAGAGTFADKTDLCGRLREMLDTMCIDVVDTFAPMQLDVDTLLALYNYTDEVLQSKLEALEKIKLDLNPRTRLLLEANAQLSVFSMTASTSQVFEIQRGLHRKLVDLAKRIELFEL